MSCKCEWARIAAAMRGESIPYERVARCVADRPPFTPDPATIRWVLERLSRRIKRASRRLRHNSLVDDPTTLLGQFYNDLKRDACVIDDRPSPATPKCRCWTTGKYIWQERCELHPMREPWAYSLDELQRMADDAKQGIFPKTQRKGD